MSACICNSSIQLVDDCCCCCILYLCCCYSRCCCMATLDWPSWSGCPAQGRACWCAGQPGPRLRCWASAGCQTKRCHIREIELRLCNNMNVQLSLISLARVASIDSTTHLMNVKGTSGNITYSVKDYFLYALHSYKSHFPSLAHSLAHWLGIIFV